MPLFSDFINLFQSSEEFRSTLTNSVDFDQWTKVEDTLEKFTVKPVLNDHSRIDNTKILITNGSLIKVESIAKCSPWSILQYF